MRRTFVLICLLCLALGAAPRPDIAGRVLGAAGEPIAGATVYVYTAGVRTGTSPYCPSCYADCGKSAKSDAGGRFSIPSVSDELVFRLLVVAPGHAPAFVERVDPRSAKPAEAKLVPRPEVDDPERVVRGRVLDPEGRPVVGARVAPFGCKTAGRRWWGRVENVDGMAVTDGQGYWALVSSEPVLAVDVEVEARGLAPSRFALLPPGTSHELRLKRGATVTGRLLHNGAPVAGVLVGLVQADRRVEGFLGAMEIGTDEQGRFTFVNVPTAGEFLVYGKMGGLKDLGATGEKAISVRDEGTTVEVGEITVSDACSVAGRVVLSDGKPIPPGTRLLVGLQDAWDSQTVELDADGEFRVAGIPRGAGVTISARVKGYRPSRQNRSLDTLNFFGLHGRVDADIAGLRILLEPGSIERPSPSARREAESWRAVRDRPIQGAEEK